MEAGLLGHGVEALGDAPVAVVGGVLVRHRRLGAGVAEPSHELLGRGAGASGQPVLGRLEELLLYMGEGDEDERKGQAGLSEITTRATGEAVGRLASAVLAVESAPRTQPVALDGCYELVPLTWAVVERADLVQLGLAAAAPRRGICRGGRAGRTRRGAAPARGRADELARVHGVLSPP